MNEDVKSLLIRDSIIGLVSLGLAMIMFFLAKFVFIEIQYTILGGAFMVMVGVVLGGWLYHIMYRERISQADADN